MAESKTTIGNQKAAQLTPKAPVEMTEEEREETLQERENALAAREARLAAMEARVMQSLDRLERAATGKPTAEDEADKPAIEYDPVTGKEIPRLDLDMPYGTVIGDPEAGFVQNGHRFSKDRRYLCEEPRGVGKPFNIKMLGLVKAPKAA